MKIKKDIIYSLAPALSFLKFGGFSGLDLIQFLLLTTYSKLRFYKSDYYYFMFVILSIFSSLINYRFVGILFSLRLILVYITFIALRESIKINRVMSIMIASLVFHLSIYPIYVYDWAVGYLAGLYCLVKVKDEKMGMAFIGAFIVYYSNQRSILVALLIAIILMTLRFRFINVIKVIVVCIVATVIAFPFFKDHRFFSTTNYLQMDHVTAAFQLGVEMARHQSYNEFVHENRGVIGEDQDSDLSLHLRLRKWSHAYVSLSKDRIAFLWGLGPSYFGKAADSTYIRLFFETGIMSLLLLFLWYINMRGGFKFISSPISIYFLLSNVFLDIFYSPLLMSFSLVALYQASKGPMKKTKVRVDK